MKALMVLAMVAASASLAQANGACSFGSECFEEEGCSFTQFSIELAGAGADARLVTDAGTVPGRLTTRDGGGALFQGADEAGAWQLVQSADGLARLAVQYFEGPMMITYFGQCEGS